MLQIAVATADRLLGLTGGAAPRLALIELPPHRDCGQNHPEWWFGTLLRRSDGRGTHLLVEAAVAGKPFPKVPRDHLLAGRLPALHPIRGDGSFDGGVRTMLASLMSDAVPTIRDMARISGSNERTFQRRLSEDGLATSDLVEEVRQTHVLRLLSLPNATAKSVAGDPG